MSWGQNADPQRTFRLMLLTLAGLWWAIGIVTGFILGYLV